MIFIDAATLSLNCGAKPVEVYIPLWGADGTLSTPTVGVTSAGSVFLADGSSSASTSGSARNLYILSANWLSNTKFAFEMAMASNYSAASAYFALWDLTSNSIVSSSQISTSNTTVAVYRSGQFTLTPGHVYGITFWMSDTSHVLNPVDASLIIFP